jgi:hypothetical protein
MAIYKIVLEMKKLLGNLDRCLDKAVTHAAAKKFEVDTLLHARLAPDMLPLSFQIQSACDQTKFVAARASGKDVPSNPDTEKTVAELKTRIHTAIAFLDTFKATDFDGTDARKISLPRWEGKSMTATDYVIEHAMPNFFFHFTTAYAILRHNGIEVGKRDYLGALTFR